MNGLNLPVEPWDCDAVLRTLDIRNANDVGNFALCLFLSPLVPCIFGCYDRESERTNPIVIQNNNNVVTSNHIPPRPIHMEYYGPMPSGI